MRVCPDCGDGLPDETLCGCEAGGDGWQFVGWGYPSLTPDDLEDYNTNEREDYETEQAMYVASDLAYDAWRESR